MIRTISLALFLLAGAAHADTWEQSTWRRTAFYRATISTEQAVPGTLQVAAVDSYEVWFNGEHVGSGSDWTQVLTVPVELDSGANHLALRVVNHGLGLGNGFLTHLHAHLEDSLLVAPTTTDRSLVPWYWSAQEPADSAWTTSDVSKARGWAAPQEGFIDRDRLSVPVSSAAAVLAGFAGDVDIGSTAGSVSLKRVDGVNLALGNPRSPEETSDGDLRSAWRGRPNPINQKIEIDVGSTRKMHKVRVITFGDDEDERERNSLRGYSVERSHDRVQWVEIGFVQDIREFTRTEVTFEPVVTDFLRILVTEEATDNSQPLVAEVEAYGTGFDFRGTYVSPPFDLGTASRKNFGRVHWDADMPVGTALSLQFRTGDELLDFEDPEDGWSAVAESDGLRFPSPEPASLVQYRVNLSTLDDGTTPTLGSLSIDFSTQDVAVSSARGSVTPNSARMGVSTRFLYIVDLAFGPDDRGVERLELAVPSGAVLGEVSGLGQSTLAASQSTNELLILHFDPPIAANTQLGIGFEASTFTLSHLFRSWLYAPGSDDPLNVGEATETSDSWRLLAIDPLQRTLGRVAASPPVLTPNSDGVNDDTVIEFVLSRTITPVRIDVIIHDLSGRALRRIVLPGVAAGDYTRSGASGGLAHWDGRDEAGQLVAPGLYVYRIEAVLGAGTFVEAGTVAVAY
ncbi:MAG: hypothetical protein HOM68_12885 [Gemmatimonadetes bacterium]|nr:hypothetical protein [Gemmatimonadota bacterium]MBT5141845.1 hypothetical protein [Gemmatimonadota bacterium]MBT5589866.1 hypothetical protein [Gemmatimonadota bacterium]MBT5963958.1 hypothetical protein [Gemmatimonadota bacterium]MBT7457958.1 hypothetical protein [Gemmatimonadota bacterium]